ncbi:hypothetical protein BHE74_00001563 [Ensete ventricosum]|nr:hypothetical protein BHE74_00001563 [Ensete ventricosum]
MIHCQRGEPRVIEQPPVAVWGECRQVPFIGRWEKARASRAESLGGRGSLLPEAFLIDVVLWVLLQHLIPPSSTKIIVELYVMSEESARLSSNRMRKLVGVDRVIEPPLTLFLGVTFIPTGWGTTLLRPLMSLTSLAELVVRCCKVLRSRLMGWCQVVSSVASHV